MNKRMGGAHVPWNGVLRTVVFGMVSVLSVLLCPIGAAAPALTLDTASISVGRNTASFEATVGAVEAVDVPITPQVFLGDTLVATGTPKVYSAISTTHRFSVPYATGTLLPGDIVQLSLTNVPGELTGDFGVAVTADYGGPMTDTCLAAPLFTGAFAVTGDTTLAANDFTPSAMCGAFVNGAGNGADQVAAIQLPYRSQLIVTLRPLTAGYDAVLYGAIQCDEVAASCFGIADAASNGGEETLVVDADADVTYYFFVDGFGVSAGAYELEVISNSVDCVTASEIYDDGEFENGLAPPFQRLGRNAI